MAEKKGIDEETACNLLNQKASPYIPGTGIGIAVTS
jgi:hypothetical protein